MEKLYTLNEIKEQMEDFLNGGNCEVRLIELFNIFEKEILNHFCSKLYNETDIIEIKEIKKLLYQILGSLEINDTNYVKEIIINYLEERK